MRVNTSPAYIHTPSLRSTPSSGCLSPYGHLPRSSRPRAKSPRTSEQRPAPSPRFNAPSSPALPRHPHVMHRSIYIHSLDLHLTLPLCACPPMSPLGLGLSALTLSGLPMPPPMRERPAVRRATAARVVSHTNKCPRYATLRYAVPAPGCCRIFPCNRFLSDAVRRAGLVLSLFTFRAAAALWVCWLRASSVW